MTIASNPNQLAPTPYVPTIEDVSTLLASKYRYSELVHVLNSDEVLAGIADAHDVLVSEMFSDKRDPNPDPKTGQPKVRTPHPVDAGSVGLAHAAMARYSVAYGLMHNLDWVMNSGVYFDLADIRLTEAGDVVGRRLNAARAAEAGALVGDVEMLQQYGPLAGWDEKRTQAEWEHYESLRESLHVRWQEMGTWDEQGEPKTVSFEPDVEPNYGDDTEGCVLESSASRAYSESIATSWRLNEFADKYINTTDTAGGLYASIDPKNKDWPADFTRRIIRGNAVHVGIANLALHYGMTPPEEK